MKRSLLGTIFTLFILGLASGQTKPELVTDRPDQSNTPILIPKGSLQIESGIMLEQDRDLTILNTNVLYNSTLIKYGVNENFELRLNVDLVGAYHNNGEIVTSMMGFSPVAAGVKVRLIEQINFIPKISLEGQVNLRLGSKDFITPYTASNFRFLFAHLFDNWTLSYNLGARWDGIEPRATFLYTLSVERSVNEKLSVFMETYSFFPERSLPDNRMNAGVMFKIKPLLQIDFSAGLGMSDNAPDYFIGAGISSRFIR